MNGQELKRIRQAAGLSQERLAYRLNISAMTVSRWERGKHRISQPVAMAIQAAIVASD